MVKANTTLQLPNLVPHPSQLPKPRHICDVCDEDVTCMVKADTTLQLPNLFPSPILTA